MTSRKNLVPSIIKAQAERILELEAQVMELEKRDRLQIEMNKTLARSHFRLTDQEELMLDKLEREDDANI